MNCVFCSPKKIQEAIIAERRYFYLLQNSMPITEGHVLLIPKRHIRSEMELTAEEDREYVSFGRWIYDYITKTYRREPLIFVNPPHQQSVLHLHKHFLPGVFGVLGVDHALRDFLKK